MRPGLFVPVTLQPPRKAGPNSCINGPVALLRARRTSEPGLRHSCEYGIGYRRLVPKSELIVGDKIESTEATIPEDKGLPSLASLRRSFARKSGLRRYIGPKRLFTVALLVAIIATGWYLRKAQILDPAVVFGLLEEHPILAPAIFVCIYGLGVLTALPTIPFNLAAGFLWGPLPGGVLSALGTTLGSIGAFLMTRLFFGRPLAERFDNKLIAEMQDEFETSGWKIVAFMRLNPVFPTGPLNYILGLTSIGIVSYSWVTFVFLLPPSTLVAYIGHSVGSFVLTGDVASALKMILSISAAGTLLAALAYGAHLFKRVQRKSNSR